MISLRLDEQQFRHLTKLLEANPAIFKNKSDIIRKSIYEVFSRIIDDNNHELKNEKFYETRNK